MKRHTKLYPQICSFENLHAAFVKARKGKRNKPAVMAFEADLEKNLHAIRRRMLSNAWRPGPYTTFFVNDGKKRLIAAAPFPDRVVHHAIVNVLEPIFEPTFIFDLYSNRIEKGSHKGVSRAREFAASHRYVLHADIRKYFPSINRAVLLELIARKIKCRATLALLQVLLDIEQPGLETGLPMGNQTSQFFANIYLSPLDHFIKEKLRIRGYLRYVDDFWIFSQDKAELQQIKDQVREYLKYLQLELKPNGCTLYRTRDSFPCLGYRVYPWTVLIRRQAVLRFRRKVKQLQKDYGAGRLPVDRLRCSLMGTMGHFAQSNSYNLRDKLMDEAVFQRRN